DPRGPVGGRDDRGHARAAAGGRRAGGDQRRDRSARRRNRHLGGGRRRASLPADTRGRHRAGRPGAGARRGVGRRSRGRARGERSLGAHPDPHRRFAAGARAVNSLAGRDIAHSMGKFALTGLGLGLLIGVTLTMAGVYRGMVDDARVMLDNSRADIWVVQKETLGPYAESSSIRDDVVRSVLGMPGVAAASNVTYLTMQVRKGDADTRAMVVGFEPGQPGEPGQLVAGRRITRSHYEAIADVRTGFAIGERITIRRHDYTVVGLTRRLVSAGGDPMVFIPLKDAQDAQFLKDNDAILNERARTAANPQLNRPGVPGLLEAVQASQASNRNVNAVLVQVADASTPEAVAEPIRRWKHL